MNNDNYYEKYQKYKLKYIEAKNQQTGGVSKIPLDKFGRTLSIPTKNIDTQYPDSNDKESQYYKDACFAQTPILCGVGEKQAGYCRTSEADCRTNQFSTSTPRKGVQKYIYGEADSKTSRVDAFGDPMLQYKPYIDLDYLQNILPTGTSDDVVENIKRQVEQIRKELTERAKTLPLPSTIAKRAAAAEARTPNPTVPLPTPRPEPRGPSYGLPPPLSRPPLATRPVPSAPEESLLPPTTEPIALTRPPPTAPLPPAPAKTAPTTLASVATEPRTVVSEPELRQQMLALTDKIEVMIRNYDNKLLSLQNDLNKANVTTQKVTSTVNQLVPIVTQIVIAYASLKNMNSSMFQGGLSRIM